MKDRARVVVRVRKIAEDRASGVVGAAHAEVLAAQARVEQAEGRCHVHPVAAQGGTMNGAALAMSSGLSAALLASARNAADMAARAEGVLADARSAAAEARAARMAAERLAERREAAAALEESRAAQRQTDESVSARHGRSAS